VGILKRGLEFRGESFISLYKTYVRPHLEYAAPAWSPRLQKDKDQLEKVQRRATKLVVDPAYGPLRDMPWYLRQYICGLTSLEERRIRGNNIQMFKLVHEIDNVKKDRLFSMQEGNSTQTTRNNTNLLNLKHRKAKTAGRTNFYTCRIVKEWNSLPNDVRNAKVDGVPNVNKFKNLYDEHLHEVKRREMLDGRRRNVVEELKRYRIKSATGQSSRKGR